MHRTSEALRTIAVAIVVVTVVGCGLSLTIALLAVRLDQAGYSGHAIGLNTAAGGVATLIGAPFIPWAARKVSVAGLLLASLILGGAALIGFTLTADYAAWMVLRFLAGLAVTVMFVLSEFWITTWAPAGRRGLVIAFYVTSLAAGFAVGPLLLTISGTAGNLPFYLGALLFVGAAIPLLFNAGGAPPLTTRSDKTSVSFLRDAPTATLAGLLHGAIEVAGLGLIPVYAIRSGLEVGEGAVLASVFVLGNAVLQLPIGLLADRIDRSFLLLLLGVLGVAGGVLLAMMGVRSLLLFEVVLLFWGGIVGAFYPVGLGQLSQDYRGADLASANSVYVMTYALGMLIGPPIIGAGFDLAPPSGLFWSIAALIALYLVVAIASVLGRQGRRSGSS